MRRPLRIWLDFAACVALVLGAMGWLSFEVLQLEAEEAEARRAAALEENVRLALWRMESALSPIVAAESARPYGAYSGFHAPERAYTPDLVEKPAGDVLMPSPLLEGAPQFVLVHFQFDSKGDLSSPQVPTAKMRDLAVRGYATPEGIDLYKARLGELSGALQYGALIARLPAGREYLDYDQLQRVPVAQQEAGQRYVMDNEAAQLALNANEWQWRQSSNIFNQSAATEESQKIGSKGNWRRGARRSQALIWRPPPVKEGLMSPLWVGERLILARLVTVGGSESLQGCLLDWPAMRVWLLSQIKDLLPAARLKPVPCRSLEDAARGLAAIPVRLVPGYVHAAGGGSLTPMMVSLMIAWSCVIIAAIAVRALLVGTVALSERRAAFVSAVTHELRTPLTAFRMYTEMLAEGMVPTEEKRAEYIGILRTEADRLGHLVENVLSYSRLEGGRGESRMEPIALGEIVSRCSERLSQRAGQAGMELVVEPGGAADLVARADTGAVEQVLFNLVDNACKYAATAEDRRIHLSCGVEGGRPVLAVSDHGPGVSPSEARKVFRPFSKSAKDAANSAPGVGLGLSLSRSLAREMGGDLKIESTRGGGARFDLYLPTA